ncbi:glyoxalase/bleomycin resistance/dioxygenase family protein (plasmid) [Cytobacillus oceanisediminis]|uniref:ArsI/CadI family heavy metal resistance metalloenzyme n=1 Tax=Cytobacillus oceanisediminis TaxID=665099 RepID=UPI001863F13F|nr:ArsI/CadI family heavy metal resistance metalloenzyme [Cytobacillus oceanisediminis]QOK29958.1 glyoxalase/bleomycin resistance/dioxygenase family protein [Cytobacillus oceanisediminis]
MKVHVGINVTDLNQSIEFYSKVFNAEPVKVKEDYAKFLLEDPGLNFTLNLKDEVSGNQVGHFGFQVENREEVFQHKERLEKLGFFAREEMDVTCCYATQDKFWVTDPDGNEWEFFYTKADVESMKTDSSCCAQEPVKIEIKTSSCCSKQ